MTSPLLEDATLVDNLDAKTPVFNYPVLRQQIQSSPRFYDFKDGLASNLEAGFISFSIRDLERLVNYMETMDLILRECKSISGNPTKETSKEACKKINALILGVIK